MKSKQALSVLISLLPGLRLNNEWLVGPFSALASLVLLICGLMLACCVLWWVAHLLAAYRIGNLDTLFTKRPSVRMVKIVIALVIMSSLLATLVLGLNLSRIPDPQPKIAMATEADLLPPLPADLPKLPELPIENTPITLETASQQPGYEFSLPSIPAERLIIPRLGVDTPLAEMKIAGTTWDVSNLYDEVAHLEGTAYPGTRGNAVLAGHVQHQRGLGPFRNLNQLEPGDVIIARGKGVEYVYLVTELETVEPDAIEITYPANNPILTLLTCTGWDNETWSYTSRMVVRATFSYWRTTDATVDRRWQRYEIGTSDFTMEGTWAERSSLFTSNTNYVYSDSQDATVTLNFYGDKVRLHYLTFWEFGIFDVYIDEEKVATIDTYSPQSQIASSDIFFIDAGWHTLHIKQTGQANPQSSGTLLALDAVDVYTVKK